jgi:hypothetical protein
MATTDGRQTESPNKGITELQVWNSFRKPLYITTPILLDEFTESARLLRECLSLHILLVEARLLGKLQYLGNIFNKNSFRNTCK